MDTKHELEGPCRRVIQMKRVRTSTMSPPPTGEAIYAPAKKSC